MTEVRPGGFLGQCLAIEQRYTEGGKVGLATCNNSNNDTDPEQQWDYYWQ